MREIIYYGNDLAKSSNAGKPRNSKSRSKSYYSNPQPSQFLVSLLKMRPRKTTSCFGCKKILEHFRFSHRWACMKKSVAWLLLVKHKDPCINDGLGRMLQICNQQKQFLSQFQMDFLCRFGFQGISVYLYIYIYIYLSIYLYIHIYIYILYIYVYKNI